MISHKCKALQLQICLKHKNAMPEMLFLFLSKIAVQCMCCKLVHVSHVIKDSKICPLICVSFHAITSVCLMQQSSSKVLVFKRSHWICGCLWWFRSWSWMEEDGKEENYSNICIYVPLWSNTQNQLQNCILDSLSHSKRVLWTVILLDFGPP